MIKKYLYQILPSLIILSIFFVFFYSPQNQAAKKKIQEINLLNKRLKKQNDSIFLEIQSYEDDLKKSDEIIESLMEDDFLLKEKIKTLNKNLTQIKSKYEQANNHANHFDSSRIQEYFSNIQ